MADLAPPSKHARHDHHPYPVVAMKEVLCSKVVSLFSPVILSEAKDLAADHDRPFAEFTLSEAKAQGDTI